MCIRDRDVIVVPGSQSGLTSILRSVVGRGRPLLIESPSYWAVSYTHLDVYKRQARERPAGPGEDHVARVDLVDVGVGRDNRGAGREQDEASR